MSYRLENCVKDFIAAHLDLSRPVLLALSGGPDSMCLLHLFLKEKKRPPLELVYVDHGWRKESQYEGEELAKLAKTLKLAFHTIRLQLPLSTKNIEAVSREARIEYFTKLQLQRHAQGILLGHQRDDLLETVFKRLLEGAKLTQLGAMQQLSQHGLLTMFRPLLEVDKQEILAWLRAEKISYFEDPTNKNERFLRSRMRETIFPFLEKEFGKNFRENLVNLAKEAQDLSKYFESKLQMPNPTVGPFGIHYDLRSFVGKDLVELTELLRRVCEQHEFVLSRVQLALGSTFLQTNCANKMLQVAKRELYFDRGHLFIMKDALHPFTEEIQLQVGSFEKAGWRIHMSHGKGEIKNSWRDLWQGSLATIVPVTALSLSPYNAQFRLYKGKTTLNRAFSTAEVPRKLAHICPSVVMKGWVVEDFLRGVLPATEGETLYLRLEKI